MNYEDCIKKGLLRKASVSKEEVVGEVKISEEYLKKAKKLLKTEMPDVSFLMSYVSMFHSARAHLFSRGYKERSHFCIFEFVISEVEDQELSRLAEIAQAYRDTRSMIQYEGSLCSLDTAKEAFVDAENFFAKTKKYLKI